MAGQRMIDSSAPTAAKSRMAVPGAGSSGRSLRSVALCRRVAVVDAEFEERLAVAPRVADRVDGLIREPPIDLIG